MLSPATFEVHPYSPGGWLTLPRTALAGLVQTKGLGVTVMPAYAVADKCQGKQRRGAMPLVEAGRTIAFGLACLRAPEDLSLRAGLGAGPFSSAIAAWA